MYSRRKRDPRTKEEVLDRMLSYDFEGDIRGIGAETASLVRIGPNKLLLTFPESGVTYELEVHRPRKVDRAEYRPGQILAPRPAETRSFEGGEPEGREVNEPAKRPTRSHPPERQRPAR